MYYQSQDDLEAGFDYATFSEKSLRLGFIRKVFGILGIQLVLTCLLILPFQVSDDLVNFVRANSWITILSYVVMIVTMLSLACCESARRNFPTNYILLFLFTCAEGFMMGCITSYYSTPAVLIAAGATALVVLGLAAFAFQTKYDFTMCGGFVCILSLLMLVFVIVLMFIPYIPVMQLVYGCVGAAVTSVYIVYDLQIMIGGTKKYALSVDDYVFAALNIYIDIVLMFQYILQIVDYLQRG